MTPTEDAASAPTNLGIDDQHAQLLRCLDELRTATAEGRTLFAVYCITRLKHHVRNHFALEEKSMRESAFPGLAEHAREHETFRSRLVNLQINSVQHDVSREMVDFLSGWLDEHFRVADGEYAKFFRKTRKAS